MTSPWLAIGQSEESDPLLARLIGAFDDGPAGDERPAPSGSRR